MFFFTFSRIDVMCCVVIFFFFKQKTAYEMRISDWSSDVCSSDLPLYYRIASNQLVQDGEVEVVGDQTSGEAEVFLFSHNGETLVSLASDHTDRKLEAHSVALSKQLCAKPVARQAWRYDDVAGHWDELILRSRIGENGQAVLYQEGTLASLQPPLDLAQDFFGTPAMPAGAGMTCGTVARQSAV